MRMISLIQRIDNDENPKMHVVVGYNEYGEYYTRWYENINALINKEPEFFLKRHIVCFWFNAECNTLLIEV